jgi:hypothetical protein
MSVVNHPTTILPCIFQSMILGLFCPKDMAQMQSTRWIWQKQTHDLDLVLLSNDEVTSGINDHKGGAILTPTASQVSTYNMGMTSASTVSLFITERCHDSIINNINPVSMKNHVKVKLYHVQQQIWKNHVDIVVLQNGWTPLAKFEVQIIPLMKDFWKTTIDCT